MECEIGSLIAEGKSKKVYSTSDPDKAVIYFKDEAMAFHGLKRGRIMGKGEVNNTICAHLFTLLKKEAGIDNHFISQLDARNSLVVRCSMIPFAVTVRNRVAGSLAERIDLPVGTVLRQPVVEYTLKRSTGEDTLINGTHIQALSLATPDELSTIYSESLRVNDFLTKYMKEINVEVIDFKLEFGRFNGKILLADEISPDSARFLDSKTNEPLGIDRFRRDLGNVEQAYQDILHRMMGLEKER